MAEFNLTPVFRMEMFIDAIIHGTTPPEPQFREEFYFAKVAGMDVELPTPITRREFYLAKYAGMDVNPPAPVTRDEMYLALACGLGVEPPEPVFRDEYWLYELSGGGRWSWKTVSGNMIHITDAIASPVQALSVAIEPQQSGSGDPSPTNVRPITGATGCDIRRCANYLYPKDYMGTQFDGYVDKYFLTSSGSLTSNSSYFVSGYMPIPPNTICRRVNSNSKNLSLCFYDENKQYISGIAYNNIVAATFTSPQNAVYVRMSTSRSASDYSWQKIDVNYTIYSVTFPDTVYGGSAELVDGSLTSEWVSYTFDGSSDENWKISSNVRYWIKANGIAYNRNSAANIICDKLKSVAAGSLSNTMENVCYIGSDPFIGIVKSSINNDLTAFRAFLAENPVHIICKRTTASEYSITPTTVSTLAGENNIWTDVNGDITLTYQAVPESAFSDSADTGMADYMTLTE